MSTAIGVTGDSIASAKLTQSRGTKGIIASVKPYHDDERKTTL